MTYPSVFEPTVTQTLIERVEFLTPDTQPGWGKMSVDRMLAHVNVAYRMTYGEVPVKNNFLVRFLLRTFVKKQVVGPKPYPKNGRTAPAFLITDERDFAEEKAKLIGYLRRTQQEGAAHYDGLENKSFGELSADEWSVLYYKHLDHHLRQFGA